MVHPRGAAATVAPKSGKASLYSLLAAGTGLMVGLDIGVIAGALDLVKEHFHASIIEEQWIVSGMMVGAAGGALIAGRASMRLGRKRTLITSAMLYVLGCLFCAVAWSIASLILARIALGIAIGIAAFTGPLYISETAEPERRGSLIAVREIFLTGGILIAFISNTLLQPSGDWRMMLGIVSLPGLIFLLFSWALPETPRWLAMKGRHEQALRTLVLLRGDPVRAQAELREIEETIRVRSSGFALFRANSRFRRSVYLGVALQIVQQLAGISIVMYYAPKIFGVIGFDATARLWGMIGVGLINVTTATVAIWLVEKVGRRPLLLVGFAGMCVALIGVGLLLGYGITTPAEKIAALACVLGFVMFFAFSAGPVVWVLCSEIQPLQGRDFGVAASTFTNWAANAAVGATFLSLLGWLGGPQTFFLYGVLNAAFIIFTLKYVPETKGVSLEHLEERLMQGHKLRDIGLTSEARVDLARV